jgi:hypothetical protein
MAGIDETQSRLGQSAPLTPRQAAAGKVRPIVW